MSGDLLMCGWRVRSALPLPELRPWPGPEEAPVDIVIKTGVVPERLDETATSGKLVMVGADGSVLIRVDGLVHILVQGGRLVTVEPQGGDGAEVWRLFLLGSVVGYLCHQRGLFPLQAAALRINGRTVAVAGQSGLGKSTMALALVRRGHGLLSDDTTVLSVRAAKPVTVLPTFPRLKLWRASLDALGIPVEGLERVRAGMEKFDLRPREGFDPAPAPLDAILILGEADETSLVPCPAPAALALVRSHLNRQHIARDLNRHAALFAQAAEIARTVPVYRLDRPTRFDALNALVALVEERFAP